MIALLRGRIHAIGDDWLVVDTGSEHGGVGYLVFCSARVLQTIGTEGDVISLLIETHVREDAITLFGFQSSGERDWFRLLLTVQGVGSRVALALLSTFAPEELGKAVISGDKAHLTRASGVGPKLAARLCTELKDKALGLGVVPVTAGHVAKRIPTDIPSATPETAHHAHTDAISALVNLGYGRSDAYEAVARASADLGDEADTARLIQTALKTLGK